MNMHNSKDGATYGAWWAKAAHGLGPARVKMGPNIWRGKSLITGPLQAQKRDSIPEF